MEFSSDGRKCQVHWQWTPCFKIIWLVEISGCHLNMLVSLNKVGFEWFFSNFGNLGYLERYSNILLSLNLLELKVFFFLNALLHLQSMILYFLVWALKFGRYLWNLALVIHPSSCLEILHWQWSSWLCLFSSSVNVIFPCNIWILSFDLGIWKSRVIASPSLLFSFAFSFFIMNFY